MGATTARDCKTGDCMGGAKQAYFDDDVDWRACQGGCHKRYPSMMLNQMGMGQDAPWYCRKCMSKASEEALAEMEADKKV